MKPAVTLPDTRSSSSRTRGWVPDHPGTALVAVILSATLAAYGTLHVWQE